MMVAYLYMYLIKCSEPTGEFPNSTPVSSLDAPDTPQTVKISNTCSLRICASFNVYFSELYNSPASTNVLYNLTFVLAQMSFDLQMLVNPLETPALRPMCRLMSASDVASSKTFLLR